MSTTTRPSPTRSSSGRAAPRSTSRRCTGRTIGTSVRGGLRPHLPLQPALGSADLPDRPDLRSAEPVRPAPLPPLLGELRAAPSWWDWQETTPPEWGALGSAGGTRRSPASSRKPNTRCCGWGEGRPRRLGPGAPDHRRGRNRSQRDLRRRDPPRRQAFQEAHGLPVDGQLGSDTWAQLIDYTPAQSNGRRARRPLSSFSARPTFGAARRPRSASLRRDATSLPSVVT